MATTLSGNLSVTIDFTKTDAGTLNTLVERVQTGVSGFDEILAQFTYGTSSSQVQKLYYNEATITAGSNSDLDLTALTDRNGAALSFSNVKVVVIVIDTPAASKKLIFKGSTATNPVALWKGSATADEDIHDVLCRTSKIDGWTVTNGATDVVRLNNPGASSVTYRIFIAGH